MFYSRAMAPRTNIHLLSPSNRGAPTLVSLLIDLLPVRPVRAGRQSAAAPAMSVEDASTRLLPWACSLRSPVTAACLDRAKGTAIAARTVALAVELYRQLRTITFLSNHVPGTSGHRRRVSDLKQERVLRDRRGALALTHTTWYVPRTGPGCTTSGGALRDCEAASENCWLRRDTRLRRRSQTSRARRTQTTAPPAAPPAMAPTFGLEAVAGELGGTSVEPGDRETVEGKTVDIESVEVEAELDVADTVVPASLVVVDSEIELADGAEAIDDVATSDLSSSLSVAGPRSS